MLWADRLVWSYRMEWACLGLQTVVTLCGLAEWCGRVDLQTLEGLQTGVGLCRLADWCGFEDWCDLSDWCGLAKYCGLVWVWRLVCSSVGLQAGVGLCGLADWC